MALKEVILDVDKYTDYTLLIRVKEDGSVKDLTGYTAEAKIFDDNADHVPSGGVMAFDTNITTPASGEITLKLTDAQTGGLTANDRLSQLSYPIWDCLITLNDDTIKVARGRVRIFDTATSN